MYVYSFSLLYYKEYRHTEATHRPTPPHSHQLLPAVFYAQACVFRHKREKHRVFVVLAETARIHCACAQNRPRLITIKTWRKIVNLAVARADSSHEIAVFFRCARLPDSATTGTDVSAASAAQTLPPMLPRSWPPLVCPGPPAATLPPTLPPLAPVSQHAPRHT